MILKKLTKDEKGFTGQDILVAIFIVTLFLSLISGIFINLSKTSKEIRYTSHITESFTKISEKIDKMTYDEVAEKPEESDNISDLVPIEDIDIDPNIHISYYINKSEDETRATQEITLLGTYTISGNENSLEMVFKKVSLQGAGGSGSGEDPSGTPYAQLTYPFNRPPQINGYKPIKHVFVATSSSYSPTINEYWIDCSIDDPTWYSIEEGYFPTYVEESFNPSSTTISYDGRTYRTYKFGNTGVLYLWIPRIAGTASNYSFAYNDTNKAIEPLDTGGYKVGTDLGVYKSGSYEVFGTEHGFLQAYSPNRNNFTGTKVGQYYRAEYLPTNLVSLIKSIRIQ